MDMAVETVICVPDTVSMDCVIVIGIIPMFISNVADG